MHEIQDYLTPEGRDPFKDWLASLADRMAKARVAARVQRLAAGNFGDCKPLSLSLIHISEPTRPY